MKTCIMNHDELMNLRLELELIFLFFDSCGNEGENAAPLSKTSALLHAFVCFLFVYFCCGPQLFVRSEVTVLNR
jgi:hypothetical protein